MSIRFWPFDSVDGDRNHDSLHPASALAAMFDDDGGVRATDDGNGLLVSPTSPASMAVQVALGSAFVLGRFFQVYGDPETLAIPAASAGARVDRVVLRLDLEARTMGLVVLQGTSGSSTPPSITRSATIYEVALARVAVGASASEVTSVTDERGDTDVCGFAFPAGVALKSHDHDASEVVSGVLADARIPNLNASKVNAGTFADARIPNLNASKVNAGTFADARIPNLNASKVNAGTFPTARGGTGRSGVTAGRFLQGAGTSPMVERTPAQVRSDIAALPSSHDTEERHTSLGGYTAATLPADLPAGLSITFTPSGGPNGSGGTLITFKSPEVRCGQLLFITTGQDAALSRLAYRQERTDGTWSSWTRIQEV